MRSELCLPDCIIEEITCARLPYRRPRIAGRNGRLDVHGQTGTTPIIIIRAGGITSFGWSQASLRLCREVTGRSISSLFPEAVLLPEYRSLELPLLDWIGRYEKKPVYALFSEIQDPFRIPVYDTSIYIDEPDGCHDREAVRFITDEIRQGMDRGHRNFKLKIGRPGIWMDLTEGLQRDILITMAARETIGADGLLMADANNAYNYNLTRNYLSETRNAGLYWLEEAFAEDDMLYSRLRSWMKEEAIHVLIADGEGLAPIQILDWAAQGLIDVLQFDARDYGFFNWIDLSRRLAPCVKAAPHNYGGFYGNFMQAHLAAALPQYLIAEWDEADAQGIDASSYSIRDGYLHVPALSGFGLTLDEELFYHYAAQTDCR